MPKIALILEDIRSTYNVGSIFRSADCFGVSHIYICGYTPAPLYENDTRLPHLANKINKQIAKAALGAESTVNFSVHQDVALAIEVAKKDDYMIAALEQSTNSVLIGQYRPTQSIALVLGNEVTGVSLWTLARCSVILEIQQYGRKESLNVASATSVALYALKECQTNN